MSCGVTYWDLSVLQHIPGCQEPPPLFPAQQPLQDTPCTASHSNPCRVFPRG